MLHGREEVINPESSAANRPLLKAINDNPGTRFGGGQDLGPLLAEMQALRQEVAALRAEQVAANDRAALQRDKLASNQRIIQRWATDG